MAENKMNAGYLAAQALVERGVNQVFFIAGGHIYPILDGLHKLGVNLVSTRHEQAAVFMAEAWGRMTRKPGVAMVTAGPGFTNALTPIAHARLSNSPLLLISGVVGLQACEKLDLQDMIQLPVITPMVKKALVCQKAERIQDFVDMAYRACISGRPGPVYLEVPVDVFNTEVPSEGLKKLNTTPECRVVDRGKAETMVEMLGRAEKPVILAGSGAYYSGAGPEIKNFIEKAGAPLFTSAQGRGVVTDTHPLCFGGSFPAIPGCAGHALRSADLIILLGNRISLYYGGGQFLSHSARIIQVDIEPEEIGRNRQVDLPVVSDVRELVRECNRLIDEKKIRGGPQRARSRPGSRSCASRRSPAKTSAGLPPKAPKFRSIPPVSPGRSISSWAMRTILWWQTAGIRWSGWVCSGRSAPRAIT